MFKTEKLIPITVTDLGLVAQDLANHFKQRDYQVECNPLPGGDWEVGITRGGIFKAAVGLKSALKIQIEPRPTGTMVRAGAGIFGKQAIPTAITMLVAWPVVLTQVWGLVREAGLDDEAVRVVELSLGRHQRAARYDNDTFSDPAASFAPKAEAAAPRSTSVSAGCTSCGGEVADSARFCPLCGHVRVG